MSVKAGQLHRQSGAIPVTAGAVMASLQRHRCVAAEQIDVERIIQGRERASNSGIPAFGGTAKPTRFFITDFGQWCLEYLEGRDRGADREGSPHLNGTSARRGRGGRAGASYRPAYQALLQDAHGHPYEPIAGRCVSRRGDSAGCDSLDVQVYLHSR